MEYTEQYYQVKIRRLETTINEQAAIINKIPPTLFQKVSDRMLESLMVGGGLLGLAIIGKLTYYVVLTGF